MARIILLAFFFRIVEAAPLLPVSSPHYALIDRLESYGCAFPTLRGYRPMPAFELLASAAIDEATKPCRAPEWVLEERMSLIHLPMPISFRHELAGIDEESLPLLGMDARIYPTVPNRRGRYTQPGWNLYNEISLGSEMHLYGFEFSMGVLPGWVGVLNRESHFSGRFYLQELYLRIAWRWLEIGYGRNELRFGPSPRAGLLLGDASAPIDRIWLGVRPQILPGFLDLLGPVGFETWITQDRDGGKGFVWGTQLSLRPMRRFEIGVIELFRVPTLDSLGTGDYFKAPFTLSPSEPTPGFSGALSIYTSLWWLRHRLKTYAQWMMEGTDGLRGRSSWLLGGGLTGFLQSEFRAEAVFTAPEAYTAKNQAPDLTYRRHTLGHPIGPGGAAFYFDVVPPAWTPSLRTELGVSWESRNHNHDPSRPSEDRWGGSVSLQKGWKTWRWKNQFLYQSVRSPKYEEHGTQNHWAVLSTLYWEFGKSSDGAEQPN